MLGERLPRQAQLGAGQFGKIGNPVVRLFSEIKCVAKHLADVDQVADFTAGLVRVVVGGDGIDDFVGQIPCDGERLAGIRVIITIDGAFGFRSEMSSRSCRSMV